MPTPGKIVDMQEHQASGIASAWLDNDTRVHHRFMDQRKDSASINITLAGGSLLEDANTRGLTTASTLAWRQPATRSLSSTEIRDLMVGTKVNVSGGPGQDTIVLTVTGNPAELEKGMQLAWLLLSEPLVEEAGFDQWKERQAQQIDARKVRPDGLAAEFFTKMILPPGEVRIRPLERAELDRITRDASQRWLDTLIAESPIEVAVVGDIDRDTAFELVTKYVGSLPSRPRVSPTTYASLRELDRPTGPLMMRREVPIQTPMAIVQQGFFGPDWTDFEDRRLLQLAGRILTTRMIKSLREEEQLVYSIATRSAPTSRTPVTGWCSRWLRPSRPRPSFCPRRSPACTTTSPRRARPPTRWTSCASRSPTRSTSRWSSPDSGRSS